MRGLSVSMEYRDNFVRADAMFRHQLVFDPRTRKVKPLTPFTKVDPSSPLAGGPLPGCKPELEDSVAYQLALGNIDPSSMEKMHYFDPDEPKRDVSYSPFCFCYRKTKAIFFLRCGLSFLNQKKS